MKNVAKSAFYVAITSAVVRVNDVLAEINPGVDRVQNDIRTTGSADQVVQLWISRLLTFLYLVAIVYALWGGFQILTAAGDDEKVTKGKNIIIQALIGIVVIFLAGSIVEFVINGILGA